jgi:hypothetical protein
VSSDVYFSRHIPLSSWTHLNMLASQLLEVLLQDLQ